MISDHRFALRTLAKSPAFSVAAIVCLALGIGVNTTIFSCLRAVLVRPFPYRGARAILPQGRLDSYPVVGYYRTVGR